MFYEFNGYKPVVHPGAFVHPQAVITGNVVIGDKVYIGPGAAIRGDWGRIVIKAGCNVQENCTIHMFPGIEVVLHEGSHIGHGAIIHGATIGRNSLIGMNAVVMDHVLVGEESIVGALTLLRTGTEVPPRSVMVGNPGKRVKDVTDEMLAWKTEGTAIYQQLPEDCRQSLRPCDPLTEEPANLPQQEAFYQPRKNSGN